MTGREIAWAAGLFEGEGTWIIRRGKSRYPTVQLGLTSCDRDVVEHFASVVECGRIYHYPAHKCSGFPTQKDQWRWETARRADGVRLAKLFLPYLGERRAARAREIIEVIETQIDGRALRWHSRKPT